MFTLGLKDSYIWLTFGSIMLPVEHDLRSSPVACGNVARHLVISNSGQAEIEDLKNRSIMSALSEAE